MFFEPRYRAMVTKALDGEGLIAMALLKPGWESRYSEKTPEIFGTVCLGTIIAHERLNDGCFNLALQGLSRAIVSSEEQNEFAYRVGRLKLASDRYPNQPVIDRDQRHRELMAGLRALVPQLDLNQFFTQMVDAEMPLGQLCDVIAHALQLESTRAHQILRQIDVDQRSDIVLECLQEKMVGAAAAERQKSFPPRFSRN